MTEPPPNVTELLEDLSAGKEHALNDLLPLVHSELRRQAARYLRRERHNHTLQPTALVNEAFIRLVDQRNVRWQNRAHFFGIAAQAMRRILIDHARTQQRIKRGGVQQNVTLDEGMLAAAARSIDVLALDQALTRLRQSTSGKPGSSNCGSSGAQRRGDRRRHGHLRGDGQARVEHGQGVVVYATVSMSVRVASSSASRE